MVQKDLFLLLCKNHQFCTLANMIWKKQKNKAAAPARNLRDFAEFKKFLGPLAKDYNVGQLHQLQRDMFSMAELLLDLYEEKKANRTRRLTDGREELG